MQSGVRALLPFRVFTLLDRIDDRPTSRTKIRYSSRNATPHDHAPASHGARSPQINSSVQSSATPQLVHELDP
jgi:hypothetical protein